MTTLTATMTPLESDFSGHKSGHKKGHKKDHDTFLCAMNKNASNPKTDKKIKKMQEPSFVKSKKKENIIFFNGLMQPLMDGKASVKPTLSQESLSMIPQKNLQQPKNSFVEPKVTVKVEAFESEPMVLPNTKFAQEKISGDISHQEFMKEDSMELDKSFSSLNGNVKETKQPALNLPVVDNVSILGIERATLQPSYPQSEVYLQSEAINSYDYDPAIPFNHENDFLISPPLRPDHFLVEKNQSIGALTVESLESDLTTFSLKRPNSKTELKISDSGSFQQKKILEKANPEKVSSKNKVLDTKDLDIPDSQKDHLLLNNDFLKDQDETFLNKDIVFPFERYQRSDVSQKHSPLQKPEGVDIKNHGEEKHLYDSLSLPQNNRSKNFISGTIENETHFDLESVEPIAMEIHADTLLPRTSEKNLKNDLSLNQDPWSENSFFENDSHVGTHEPPKDFTTQSSQRTLNTSEFYDQKSQESPFLSVKNQETIAKVDLGGHNSLEGNAFTITALPFNQDHVSEKISSEEKYTILQKIDMVMPTPEKPGYLKLELSPAHLGQVDINVTINEDGRLDAVVHTEKTETFHLLSKDSGELQRVISEAFGKNIETFNLSMDMHHQGHDHHHKAEDLHLLLQEKIKNQEALQDEHHPESHSTLQTYVNRTPSKGSYQLNRLV